MRRGDLQIVELEEEAQHAWMEYVAEVAKHTLCPEANSWYLGVNILSHRNTADLRSLEGDREVPNDPRRPIRGPLWHWGYCIMVDFIDTSIPSR